MNGVLNKSLVDISELALRERGGVFHLQKPLMDGMYAELFEQLLLFDKVSVSLNPMSGKAIGALLERFKLNDLIRALALEAIELVLPSVMSVSNSGPEGRGRHDPSLLTYQPPVMFANITGAGSIDAERIIRDGLRYTSKFTEREKEHVIRELSPYITRGPLTDGDEAYDLVMDAYNSNSLATIGLPFTVDAFEFDYDRRVKYQQITGDVEDLLFVASNNYGMYKSPAIYEIAKTSVGNIEDALNVQRTNDKLLTSNALPNLRMLYSSGKANFTTALELRESADNIEFRRWIYSISDPQEYDRIVRHYASAIAQPRGFSQSSLGKLAKGVTMYGLGQLLSSGVAIGTATILGGVPGLATALGAGLLTQTLLKTTGEVTGNLFLDKMAGYVSQGWTPYQFVQRVERLAEPSIPS
jgi:hypothetical protein